MSCCGPKPAAGDRKFNADYRGKPLTMKFWSNRNSLTEIIDPSRIVHYEAEIEKNRKYDARCHSKIPRYTSQTYGWMPGYKIRFLQNCDLHICQNPAIQRVAKDLLQQHFKDQCAKKKLIKTDHWKIV